MIWAKEVKREGDLRENLEKVIEELRRDFEDLESEPVKKLLNQRGRLILTFGPVEGGGE